MKRKDEKKPKKQVYGFLHGYNLQLSTFPNFFCGRFLSVKKGYKSIFFRDSFWSLNEVAYTKHL